MPDLPGGDWTPLLIGHQWPGSASLAALAASERNRAATAAAHNHYAESLRAVRMGALAGQQGVAADAARHLFQSGEDAARGIAESNEAKRDSYRWAHRYVAELRSALQDIARDGNSEIRRVLDSRRPLAEKVSAIVGTIAAAQTQANVKAAECSAGVLGAMETALGTAPSGLSAREFTKANGVDLVSAFRSPNQPDLQRQVSTALGVGIPDTGESPGSPAVESGANPVASNTVAVETIPGRTEPVPATGGSAPTPTPTPTPTSTAADSPAPGAATAPGAESADLREPVRPDPGALRGSVIAAGAEAIADSLGNSGGSAAIPEPSPPTDARPPADSAGLPIGDVAAPIPTPTDAGPATVVAPAVIPNALPAAVTAGASAPSPPGLQTYGSDLRTASATAAPGAPVIPAANPGSAPAGAAAPGPPLVVRRAVAAAAGATVGSGAVTAGNRPTAIPAARGESETRLRRLLGAVARQQPRLRWAVGDLEDGDTVLVTDLAAGWIPPGIDIPAGVRLLQPPGGTGDLATLLGPATSSLTYQPGQRLPPADGDEPIPMSGTARQGTPVDDLGWRLTRATKWRDGLPRLAHTIARAASARSGVLDSEVELLGEHLGSITRSVLDRYPDPTGGPDIGNWQLLATIDAVLLGETTTADYHFAWFLSREAMSPKGGSR